jgi:hypothetical protein
MAILRHGHTGLNYYSSFKKLSDKYFFGNVRYSPPETVGYQFSRSSPQLPFSASCDLNPDGIFFFFFLKNTAYMVKVRCLLGTVKKVFHEIRKPVIFCTGLNPML